MVRSCEIISECLRAVSAEEYGSGMSDLAEPFERIINTQLEVLRRDLIGNLNCLLEVFGNDDLAVVVDRRPCDLFSLETSELVLNGILNRQGELFGICYENRARVFVVFCL